MANQAPPPEYTEQPKVAPGQGQPMYPQLSQPQQQQPQAMVVTQTVQKEPSAMRAAIPALPLALGIIYGILNFLIPGLGTILAGFSVLCCGNAGQSGGGRVGTFCINFWVGIVQIILVPIFLIGWIWSIIWGVALITLAASPNKSTTTTTVVAAQGPQTSIVTVST
ncbi:protein SPEC3-like [Styela clava]|uniref:protein SPEC3-like n=1 Tax=Styela clava TaxID=7725 RepID=UPI00193A5846|nr:protein SPEC3-like [Styela clava]